MKTYTFKVKLHYASEKNSLVLSVVHCPLEVLFDSLKEVKQFDELFKVVNEPSNKEVPRMYITASDYVNNNGEYVHEDYIFCDYKAIIESDSLAKLLTHSDYYGFIEDCSSSVKTEYNLVCEIFNFNQEKLKKETEESEV